MTFVSNMVKYSFMNLMLNVAMKDSFPAVLTQPHISMDVNCFRL